MPETTPDVAAHRIHRAAARIRETAGDVTTVGHDWTVHPPTPDVRDWTIGSGTVQVATTPDYGQWYLPDHIASWAPPTTILAADLLDTIADEITEALADHDDRLPGTWPAAWNAALALATHYLDKDPRQ
jgi:hypothetical protein